MLSNVTKIDYAIFTAMTEELEYYQQHFSYYPCTAVRAGSFEFKIYHYKNKLILLTPTGLGTTFATAVLTFVHQQFRPEHVFLSGTAGRIKSDLKLCDIIIAEKAFEAEIQSVFSIVKGTPFEGCLRHPLNHKHFPAIYSASESLLKIANETDFSDLNIFSGTVVTSNAFPAPLEIFERIKSEDPYSIDMETSAFYLTAWLLNISVLAVRGISNLLNHDGTDDKVHESDVEGSANCAAMATVRVIDRLVEL